MIMIDTDVFVMDNFFTSDPRFETNSLFLHRMQNTKNFTTVYNLLEVCSLIAPHCSEPALLGFFENFDRTYNVEIIYPKTYDLSADYFLDHYFGEVLHTMPGTGNLMDSMIFCLVKQAGIRVVVSWNAVSLKQRIGKIGKMEFLKPDDYLKFYKSMEKK